MGQIAISGSITGAPSGVTDGSQPQVVLTGSLGTTPDPKPSMVQDKGNRSIATALNVYTSLGSVGANQNVTAPDFLYLKTDAPLKVRLTVVDPNGGSDIVSILPIFGMLMLEFEAAGPLKLLEATGTAGVEYLVSGQS